MVGQRIVRWGLAVILAAGILVAGAAAAWHLLFDMPCCIRMGIRGLEMDVETIKRIEEREKDGSLGITRIAGWRIESQKIVSAVSTGRRQTAQIIGVYGSMELVEPAHILSGRYGLAEEEDYCVLSAGSYTHLRAHEPGRKLGCRLLLEKKKKYETRSPRKTS